MTRNEAECLAMKDLSEYLEIPISRVFGGNTTRVSKNQAGITIHNLIKIQVEYNKDNEEPISIQEVIKIYGVMLNEYLSN